MSNEKNQSELWVPGQDTEGKLLRITLPLVLKSRKITKGKNEGKDFLALGEIGNSFGGVILGQDAKGYNVMLKVTAWLKKPVEQSTPTVSKFNIG